MKKYVLVTYGLLANRIYIRDGGEDGKLLYTTEKSLIDRFFLLMLRPWYNPVNFKFKGVNNNVFEIKDISRHKHVLIENNKEIGQLKGRKVFAVRYKFQISMGDEEYFFEGDDLVPITKVYKNNVKVGEFRVYNQKFPKFNWEAEVIPEMDPKLVTTGLLYNYLIWGRT